MSASKTIGRDLPDGTYVQITCQEHDGFGAQFRGFSITGAAWEKHGTWSGRTCARAGRDCDSAGQIVDLIRRVAPELEPLLAVHLADSDGVPMYALSNGWYFYSAAHLDYELRQYGEAYVERHGSSHERAARALHIPPADLPKGLDRAGFVALVDSLAPRWAARAVAARAVLGAMVDGEGVEGS